MSQKEYLKMADVFPGDVEPCQISGWKHQVKYVPLKTIQQYAAHAINSHDELVAEIERLRKIVDEGLVDDVFLDGCHAGWDASGEGYNAEYNNSDDGKIHSKFVVLLEEYKKGL